MDIGGGQVALLGSNGRYVSAELGYGTSNPLYGMLRARATSVGAWERFTMVFIDVNGSTYTAFRAANGLWVSAELGYSGSEYGMLRARAGSIGPWELFGYTPQ
jgi:hypothetical protein